MAYGIQPSQVKSSVYTRWANTSRAKSTESNQMANRTANSLFSYDTPAETESGFPKSEVLCVNIACQVIHPVSRVDSPIAHLYDIYRQPVTLRFNSPIIPFSRPLAKHVPTRASGSMQSQSHERRGDISHLGINRLLPSLPHAFTI